MTQVQKRWITRPMVALAATAVLLPAAPQVAGATSTEEPPTEQEVREANEGEVFHSDELRTTDLTISVPAAGGDGLTASAVVTCTLSGTVESWYRREAFTFRTTVHGEADAITRCDGDPSDPVKSTIDVRVTDFGTPVFGSPQSDRSTDSGGRDVPLLAIAETDTPVYSFPATVHGVGSLYTWEYRFTIQIGDARNDVCVEGSAIDPFGISQEEVPC